MAVKEYEDRDGTSPFTRWFESLDAVAAAKIVVALSRLERGAVSNAKSVGEGVFEYRIDFGPGYRLYFGRDGQSLVILLLGGSKKRQQRDIDTSKAFWTDYKTRKKGRS